MKRLVKLKVCGMKDPQNISELVSVGPDYIGFIFYPSSRRFVGDLDLTMVNKLVKNISKVAVFVNEPIENVVRTVLQGHFECVQLHGDESPEYCREIKEVLSHVNIIKVFNIDEEFEFSIIHDYKPFCNYFLFDTKTEDYGGSGKSFNWKLLEKYDNEVPYFLSGGIGEEEIKEILELKSNGFNIHAIDINSKAELEPGIKDIQKVVKIIESIQA
jgi:phosphoribosylanthranilate isomerase